MAAKIRPQGLSQAVTESDREGLLKQAYSLWWLAKDITDHGGRTADELEHDSLLNDAQRVDAENEALEAAKKQPEATVSWTDAQLWAALGDGPRNSKETPGQVAERLYKRFKARMEADGRGGEARKQSEGVKFGFVVDYLREVRKPGPKPAVGNNSIAAGNLAEETPPVTK